MTSIWKDKYFNLGTADSASFSVSVDGTVVYTGKAWKRPDASSILVKVNDIVADYLHQTVIPDSVSYMDTEYITGYMVTVVVTNTDNGTTYTETFVYDWSYTARPSGCIQAPISRELASGVIVPFTISEVTEPTEDQVEYEWKDASGEVVESGSSTIGIPCNAWFNNHYYADTLEVTYNGITQRYTNLLDTCKKHVLIYVNAYGAWDTLVLASAKRKDTFSRSSYERDGEGTVDYRNEGAISWECVTPLLTDEGAGNMHHLMGSNVVYMYDTITRNRKRVRITTNECPHKSFRGEGGKVVYYTFNVEECEKTERR